MMCVFTLKRLCLFCLLGFAVTFYSLSGDTNKTVFYQIYIRGFYDSNGDGLGDIQGVIEKLDYLEELGVGGLWLMPLFRAPTDHKYFSSDYFMVDPEYGTNEDLEELVQEAHKRGIQVIIDFMVNHTSVKHPWFHASTRAYTQVKEGRETIERQPYLDYYHWAWNDDIRTKTPETYTIDGELDETRLKNWKQAYSITGEPVGKYYSRFVDAPDLNYDNPVVREEIKKVGRFWLEEIGVDGFRLDAARHIYDCENGQAVTEDHRNYIWWSEFCADMKAVKPDCLIIGEIWSNPKVMASYLKTGLDSVFDFALGDTIRKSVKEGSDQGILKVIEDMNAMCRPVNEDFVNSTFLENHDFPRLMTLLEDDESMVRLAVSILLTLPGRPFIYYGDELGLRNDKHLIWMAMPWDDPGEDSGQTSWMASDKQFLDGIRPLTVQSKDPDSLQQHFKGLIQLRNCTPELSSGEIRAVDLENTELLSYVLNTDNESSLVIHNLSEEVHSIDQSNIPGFEKVVYSTAQSMGLKEGKFTVPGRGTVVLQGQ